MARSHEFTCIIEQSIHFSIWTMLIAVIIFICVNLARILLVRGLLRLWLAIRFQVGDDKQEMHDLEAAELKTQFAEDDERRDIRPIVWHCNVTKSELCQMKSHMPRDSLRRFFEARDESDRTMGWMLIVSSAGLHFLWIGIVHLNVI
jgi:hypothetical protein